VGGLEVQPRDAARITAKGDISLPRALATGREKPYNIGLLADRISMSARAYPGLSIIISIAVISEALEATLTRTGQHEHT